MTLEQITTRLAEIDAALADPKDSSSWSLLLAEQWKLAQERDTLNNQPPAAPAQEGTDDAAGVPPESDSPDQPRRGRRSAH